MIWCNPLALPQAWVSALCPSAGSLGRGGQERRLCWAIDVPTFFMYASSPRCGRFNIRGPPQGADGVAPLWASEGPRKALFLPLQSEPGLVPLHAQVLPQP